MQETSLFLSVPKVANDKKVMVICFVLMFLSSFHPSLSAALLRRFTDLEQLSVVLLFVLLALSFRKLPLPGN